MNETELLFTEILGCSRLQLHLEKGRKLSREDNSRISGAFKRRISGEPIQYILGHTEFMGFDFKVNPAVLIPRPDTEVLVETALRYAARHVTGHLPVRQAGKSQPKAAQPTAEGATGLNILDIGTGSGCIAVSLARLNLQAKITATDISPEALEIARQNAVDNGVADRINFLNCDLFPPNELRAATYELIISNPPYIKTDIIQTLEVEVRHEPRLALDGGADGLGFYRRIFSQAGHYLKAGGALMLEIGFDQKEALGKILESAQIFEVKETIKDYNNINRVLVLKLKG